MTDITELTAEKLEEIRQRYRPTLAPKCHICGVEMTIQRMSASRITYGCAGAIYDETGCHYAEGRSLADDHYAESRITVVDVSDPDVLAMVEALEKAQAENTAGVAGMAESYETTISMLRSRIAELESHTVKPPVHPTVASENLDDETLQELIEFRRTTFEYHSKEGNKVQTIIHGVTLAALRELLERRKADSEPVAEVVSIYGDPEAFGERELDRLSAFSKCHTGRSSIATRSQRR